jgi:S1-C subfamily serine protease
MATSVDLESPAAKAGLRERDIILSLAGASVGAVDELHRLLSPERVGKPQHLMTLRGSLLLDLTIVPENRPD